ncbi:related to methyltransferase [Phialocephala subalpina]|uniref:Related to methyltransferase n=1 Tax=Phialocephala subalpina TaxID=576137 RepID=A0A1L7WZU5_9HELO|nr:related to methyltransferase [Phialocephala subalpina]
MSAEIKEGETTILGSPPKSPAKPLTPPTAGEDETALVSETTATIPAGETISIDPLDADAETDSAYGDDDASSTASIASSIRNYREFHGRTYHNFNTETTSEYWGPNDEKMNEQLDIGHHMLTLMLDGKLFLAPIGPNPQKVLDVGTGTGIWAIDFADQFPSAEVIGTDISPTQPSFVPPNLKFELDDAQLEWTYQPNGFDYIHVRCLLGAIQDWAHLYREIYKCTKPGGYIEHLEISIMFKSEDGSLTEDHFMVQWSKTLLYAAEQLGKTFAIYDFNREMITKAGFVDVVEKKFKVPVGTWPSDPKMKELGQHVVSEIRREDVMTGRWTDEKQWSYEEIQAHIATMRKQILNRKNHAYYDINVVYGRKPGGVSDMTDD